MRCGLDVVARRFEAEAGDGEVRAAQDGLIQSVLADVIELAVKKSGSGDRTDFDLVAYPSSAIPCSLLLGELVSQCKLLPLIAENEMASLLLILLQVSNG